VVKLLLNDAVFLRRELDKLSQDNNARAVVIKVVSSGPMSFATIATANGYVNILPMQAFVSKVEEGDVVFYRSDGLWEKDWEATANKEKLVEKVLNKSIEENSQREK